MNPSQKGWLKEFLSYRKDLFVRSKELEKTRQGQHPDQSFYGLIQPTGIMYGYPVHIHTLGENAHWDRLDTIKVLLADSFINIAELYAENPVETEKQLEELMYQTMDSLNHFYNGVYPEIAVSMTNWLGQKKDVLSLTEKIIEKRVEITFKKTSNFWTDFFHHSQLFLDIYIFGQWSHTQPDKVLLEFFKEEKEELSYTAVKVMSAAAHANKSVEDEEQLMFEHFIENSGLPAEKRRVAYEYFDHGLGIQDIPVEETDPWVIRKFFLELAVLTVWSDKKIERIEWTFLDNFNQSLGFSDEDFDNSMIAVEGFILQNWDKLGNLHVKSDPHEIGADFVSRISKIAEKYKNRLKAELMEDKALHLVLRKGSAAVLNTEEKEEVRQKFLQMLKTLPNLRVISLPDAFLSYDMMLKVIPKDIISEVHKV